MTTGVLLFYSSLARSEMRSSVASKKKSHQRPGACKVPCILSKYIQNTGSAKGVEHVSELQSTVLNHDYRIVLAVKFYEDQLLKPKPERWSIHYIAGEFSNTYYSTLWGRLQGAKTLQSSHESQQKLTIAQEVELLDWLLRLSDTHSTLTQTPYSCCPGHCSLP